MARLHGRGRGTSRVRSKVSSGRQDSTRGPRYDFKTSRLEDAGLLQEQDPIVSEIDGQAESPLDGSSSPADSDADRDEDGREHAYTALLQSLHRPPEWEGPARKRRKSNRSAAGTFDVPPEEHLTQSAQLDLGSGEKDEVDADGVDTKAEDTSDSEEEEEQSHDDDEEKYLSDPFESHFARLDSDELTRSLQARSKGEFKTQRIEMENGLRQTISVPTETNALSQTMDHTGNLQSLKLKRRISASARSSLRRLRPLDQAVAAPTFAYQDVMFGGRTVSNGDGLRNLVTIHALNHVFKTRDRVLKNNDRLSRSATEELDLRDQGFTRPKILFLLPTRQSCVKVVDCITAVCEPEQQENKSRFAQSFSEAERKPWDDKPADFRELFSGNDDDMFRIGLKCTRKNLKYFSQFYASDIILASPLGLRTAIDKDDGKKHDHDFLSSIEVVVVDQADALLMQNWEHVEYVFSQLNLLPKDPHGCDFSRVRNWYLENQAKYLRQTIVLSAFITPEINSLYSNHMHNVAGRVKITPNYTGTLLSPALPMPIKQTFSRFASASLAQEPDDRFAYFTSAILPSLLKYKPNTPSGQGTLIFVPSYLDFVRLRNHLSHSTNISFGSISEYTPFRDVARARSHFVSGRHVVLLYTERAHHFRRYRSVRGVKRVVMYALPDNPVFWAEVVGYLGQGAETSAEASVRAVFSKWDALKLERVVGTARVGSMVNDGIGDTFDFV